MDTRDCDNTQESILQFGIMCSSTKFQEWQANTIKALLSLKNVKPALLVIDVESKNNAKRSLSDKFKGVVGKHFFYKLCRKFFLRPKSASRVVSLADVLSTIPSIECKVIKKGKYSQYFSKEDISKISKYNLDFILRFAFGIIRGEILTVPRYGIWSFHHDDEQKYRGQPPGFWEIYNDDNVTGAVLQRLTDKLDAGIILKKGYFKTIKYAYSKSIGKVYLESANWPRQVCVDIQNGAAPYVNGPPSVTNAKVFHMPNNVEMAKFLTKMIKTFLVVQFKSLLAEEWNIGIVRQPIYKFLDSRLKPKIDWLPKPKRGTFRADPFGFIRNDDIYVLYEDYNYSNQKAHISILKFEKNKTKFSSKIAIKETHHLSYPFILEHDDDIYCIPEAYETNEIHLYKLNKKSNRWENVSTLLKGFGAVDSTIFKYEGRWWLFCAIQEEEPDVNLFAWYSSNLPGLWSPHLGNPIKTDIRSSRPAGTPFFHNGNLYRPSQDSSDTYGGRIIMNRIVKLTTTEFHEEQVTVIMPQQDAQYSDGLHTLSAIGNYTVIDGKRFIVTKSEFINILRRKVRKCIDVFYG